jgi:hypothetical protein
MNQMLLALSFEECQRRGIWSDEIAGQEMDADFLCIPSQAESVRFVRVGRPFVTNVAPMRGIAATVGVSNVQGQAVSLEPDRCGTGPRFLLAGRHRHGSILPND